MNDALVSEFLIALFAGMVAFAIIRRSTSRPVELVLWVGLVWVCVLGVTSTHDKQTRELTAAAVWGSTQIMGTIAGLLGQGALGWVSANRMAVADWVVLIFGLDLLAIVLLRTHRTSAAWQPRARLRDWMEMPRPGKPQPALAPAASGTDEMNERFNRWAPLATAGALMQLTLFLIWSLDVFMPATGRRVRDAVIAAQGARRRVVSGEVVDFETLAGRAASVRGWASGAINQVASAPQFDWMSGYAALPQPIDGEMEIDDEPPYERDRRDRLAS